MRQDSVRSYVPSLGDVFAIADSRVVIVGAATGPDGLGAHVCRVLRTCLSADTITPNPDSGVVGDLRHMVAGVVEVMGWRDNAGAIGKRSFAVGEVWTVVWVGSAIVRLVKWTNDRNMALIGGWYPLGEMIRICYLLGSPRWNLENSAQWQGLMGRRRSQLFEDMGEELLHL